MSNRNEIADAFGKELDPLAQYEQTFIENDLDPFEPYWTERMDARNLSERTIEGYEGSIRQYRAYMDEQGRHPACPSEEHTTGFARNRRDEHGNSAKTILIKVKTLRGVYTFWQDDPAFPHDTDYNPWTKAIELVRAWKAEEPDRDDPPRLTPEELKDRMADIPHVRDRLVIAMQLKFGLRASELANLDKSHVHVANQELQTHYPEMGSDTALDGRENAVVVPGDIEGNKTGTPRVLPIDDEMRRLSTKYLLTRPDNDESALILSDTTHERMTNQGINGVWKKHFGDFDGSGKYTSITSHYGRHRFTTYWRVEQDISREFVKYMRGDAPGGANGFEGIDHYLHTYYEDIEPIYRERIYRLGL